MNQLTQIASEVLPLVILASIRIGVAFAAMPPPFGSLSPVPVRAGFGVVVAAILTAPAFGHAPELSLSAVVLARAAIGELLVGAVIGVTVRVTLAAVEMAGTFAGFSMGLGFATSIDPMYGESNLPTSRLLGAFAMLIFLIMQGHHVVLSALAASLRIAPPGDAFSAVAHEGIVVIGSQMVAHALRISAPVVATMFIVQLGTGLVSRAAPRVHIFALSFAVASAAGTLALFIAAPSLAAAIATEIEALPSLLVTALGAR